MSTDSATCLCVEPGGRITIVVFVVVVMVMLMFECSLSLSDAALQVLVPHRRGPALGGLLPRHSRAIDGQLLELHRAGHAPLPAELGR